MCIRESVLLWQGPTREEVQQTLSQIRSELLLSMENTHNRMNNNARHMLYMERIVTMEETLAELERVTIEDIMDYMEQFFKEDLQSITMMGNVEADRDLERIFDSF